ncbi:MAG: T9SS type A sorting domain-containing protein [Algibacter sp.]|uniref:T9SS type A sorting domain-containing protein n=1 Tax=Algibacter sp. TaxID=1872428 RepID=UPI00329A6649
MKSIIPSKLLFFIIALCCTVSFGFGQTTLAPGDIAITGFITDNPDEFSFVLLRDVDNGTKIKFTDKGWDNAGYFRTSPSEGVITWTAPSYLECGTEVVIADIGVATGGTAGGPFSSTIGTAIETDEGFALAGGPDLSDQIIVFQGDLLTPTLLYAVQFRGTTGWTNATNNFTSGVPAGLTDGVDAIYYTGNNDNGSYNCTITSGSALILADVIDQNNWYITNSNTAANRPVLGSCSYTCDSCTTTVTWDGTSWVGGTPDLTTGAILSTNYNTDTNGGSFSACSLTVNNGATLIIADNDYVEVENDLTVDLGGEITVRPYGAFVQNNDLGTVTYDGLIIVEKENAPADVWYEYTYWSSPVQNETIEYGLAETEASRIFKFNAENYLDIDGNDVDDDGNDWQWVSGTTVMEPGVGYASTQNSIIFGFPSDQITYTFEGPFNNGEIKVPVYRNDTAPTNDNNWNLIGNPYPSAIDAQLFLDANVLIEQDLTGTDYSGAGFTDGAIFLWSQKSNYSAANQGNEVLNFSSSDYAIINGTGQTAGGDGLMPNRYIPSGQSFFISMSDSAIPISTDANNVSEGEVVFNNSMRVYGNISGVDTNGQFFKNSKKNTATLANKLGINLTSDNGVFNQTLIGYIKGASNADDGSYFDALKNLSSGSSAILYTTIEDTSKKYAIQGKAINSINEDEIINLGFKTAINVATLYKLSIAQLEGDFLTNNTIYLKDNLLNKVHNLSDSDYSFTSEVGEFNERFDILFKADSTLSIEQNQLDANSLKIVELDNDQVQFTASKNIASVSIFDLLGRQLYEFKGNTTSETYNVSQLSGGSIYIAKVTLSTGAIITKKALKK